MSGRRGGGGGGEGEGGGRGRSPVEASSSSSSTPKRRRPTPAELAPTPRPGIGTLGRKVWVKANHFLAEVADKHLRHYHVYIQPEVASKAIGREIMNQVVATYKDSHLGGRLLAYDGDRSCYVAGELPFQSQVFSVVLVDNDGRSRRERNFTVSIKYASTPDLHHLEQYIHGRQVDLPQETLQLLDVVLSDKPSQSYAEVGRSFFSPRLGQTGELGSGLIYWKGFYQSLRPTQMGLSLNVNMSARAFFEPTSLVEYVLKHINSDATRRGLSHQDTIKVKGALKGVKVETKHLGYVRRYRISSITTQSIQQLKFAMDGTGAQISVEEYFRQKHRVSLQYPSLQAVQAGSDTKPTYLPMELCRIVEGQRYSKRLDQRQVTALLRATCQRPHDRENSIKQMVRHNNYNEDELVNGEFGISIRPEMTSIEARVLDPPKLRYHDSSRYSLVVPSMGQWNMMNKKMVNGGKLEFWACINFSSRMNKNTTERFCNDLIDTCRGQGMECSREAVVIRDVRDPRASIEAALFDIQAETRRRINDPRKQLQLLIVILPDKSGSYGTIKRVCETELGIVTQCCQQQNLTKPSHQLKQYMENVSLKINAKVGGRNNVLDQALKRDLPYLTDCPTIIFGADVTHPQTGEDSSPSIAAVVASMDWPEATKYRALVSAQAHREEIILDLCDMTRDLLVSFNKATGLKPRRIIFYRDGVGEGQFSQVLLHEMDAIRKACKSVWENYMPRVTFIVVQKRHNTRLFAGERSDTDRSGNVLPGTVVDTKICHPTQFDFYLCSHAGIQGTSRPTHYHVLYDENGFTADGLQTLTYSLCYTYARCTRSVSIVPPAYYAHLVAYRARYYIEGTDVSDRGSTSDAAGTSATRRRNREVRSLPTIKDCVKDVMFYV